MHHLNTADLQTRSSSSSTPSNMGGVGPNDLVSKQQQHRSIPQQQQYKQQPPFNIRYPSPSAFFHHQQQQQQSTHLSQQLQPQKLIKLSRQNTPSPHQSNTSGPLHKISERSVTPCHPNKEDNDSDVPIEMTTTHHDEAAAIRDRDSGNSSAATTSSITSSMIYKDSLEQLLQRRHSGPTLAAEAGLKTYSQILINSSTPTDTSSCKEKSSSSSTSSTPPPAPGTPGQLSLSRSSMLKSPSDTSSLFSEPIEEETRCVVCNAHFPNVWLLEQHAALQHPLLGPGEEKPFICEQCGQSYRYRSAYAKHKETNHRSRLPADKLFTCDVCGMQFRYLKSFKKHRLNHALERLHGKKGKHPFAMHLHQQMQEHEMISGGQESSMGVMGPEVDVVEDLRINIKKEREDDDSQQQQHPQRHDNEQNDGIDSTRVQAQTNTNEPNIECSDGIHSTNKRVSFGCSSVRLNRFSDLKMALSSIYSNAFLMLHHHPTWKPIPPIIIYRINFLRFLRHISNNSITHSTICHHIIIIHILTLNCLGIWPIICQLWQQLLLQPQRPSINNKLRPKQPSRLLWQLQPRLQIQ